MQKCCSVFQNRKRNLSIMGLLFTENIRIPGKIPGQRQKKGQALCQRG
jgi:hypothetical protein